MISNQNHNLCRISSDLRTSGTESNFVQNFNNMPCCQSVTALHVKSVDFVNCFPNISEDTAFNTSIGNHVVPKGQYTISQLITEIETNIPGLTITLGADKHIVCNAGVPSTYGGFTPLGLQPVPVAANPVRADNLPNLSGVDRVYIRSQRLTDGSRMIVGSQSSGGEMQPILVTCEVDVPFGSWVHWRAKDHMLEDIEFPSFAQGRNIRDCDISIEDKEGNNLDLQGLSFNMVLRMTHNSNN